MNQRTGYQKAVERARQYPSQIADIEEIVHEIERGLDLPDFEIKIEIYQMLVNAKNSAECIRILQSYQQGLDAISTENRLRLQRVWRVLFNNENAMDVLFDPKHKQLILATSPRESDVAGVYAFDTKTGQKHWSYQMPKRQSAWRPQLGESAVFFTSQSHVESDSHFHRALIYSLNLSTGKLMWKSAPKNDRDDNVEQVIGVVGDILVVKSEFFGSYIALDTFTASEIWRQKNTARVMWFPMIVFENTVLVQNSNRELAWLDYAGKLHKTLELQFPKKDEGYIDHSYIDPVNPDVIYLSVYGYWHEYGKKGLSIPGVEKTDIVFYAIDKRNAKIIWSLNPKVPRMRCKLIVTIDDRVYFCGHEKTVVVKKNSGKLLSVLPYGIQCAFADLFFHTDPADTCFNDSFTFYARDIATTKISWQCNDFQIFESKEGLLYGRVKNDLVILDALTGKEKGRFSFQHQPIRLGFTENHCFWVIADDWKSLTVFDISGEN